MGLSTGRGSAYCHECAVLILVYMGLTVLAIYPEALTDCRARSVPERYADIRSAWWN